MLIDDQVGHKNNSSVFTRFSTFALIASLALFGFSTAAQAALPLVSQIESINGVCGGDVLGQAFGSDYGAQEKGCNAGEISIASVTDVVFNGGTISECVNGTPLTITTATVNYEINTQSRADMIMWIGDQEGTDPRQEYDGAAGRTCGAYSLPGLFNPTPDTTNPFGNIPGDDDQCGDLAAPLDGQASRTFTNFTFQCQDNDGDGFADTQILLTWVQNAGDACGMDTGESFPVTGAKSKCDFQLRNSILPIVFPPILTLVKEVNNIWNGPGAVGDWTLTATGPTTPISGVTGSAAVTDVVVEAGDYDLTESDTAGYTGTWACDGGTLVNDTLTLTNFAGPDPGEAARTITCTLTNDDLPANLTLVKNLVLDSGGNATETDWTLSATGPSVISGAGGVAATDVNAGIYALAETAGPSGFTPSAWSCEGGSLTDSSLTLLNGETAVCTITNNDDPATLTLIKQVTNPNGGNAVADDWTLTADGVTDYSGNTAFWTGGVEVDADTYTLSESTVAGYAPTGEWQCTGGSQNGAQITITTGQTVICQIINTDVAPGLTLNKVVTNDNGGNDPEASFNLTLTGADGTHAAGVDYNTGATPAVMSNISYTVSEIPNTGYTLTSIVCLDDDGGADVGNTFVLNEGQNVTCTFNNDDDAPTLTVVKDVNTGAEDPANFVLRVEGCGLNPATAYTSGESVAGVQSNCVLTVSEDEFAGYTQTSVACVDTGNGNASVSHPVTLEEGQAVSCTVTNDEVLTGTITVVKSVLNPQGGTLGAADFPLQVNAVGTSCNADGTDQTSPYTIDTPGDACVYTITETLQPGYTLVSTVCTEDGGAVVGNVITYTDGETWNCVVTNDDVGAVLTLVKTVTNNNGGTAVETEWTLTANGPTPISGVTATVDVTAVTVNAGEYALSESGGPTGYVEGDWSCEDTPQGTIESLGNTGGRSKPEFTLVGSTLTLVNGDDVTCTIDNDDEGSTLTLAKQVINLDGGLAVVDDWTLTADGVTDYSGNTTFWTGGVEVDADTYTLSEDTVAGYAPTGDWQCTGGTFTPPDQLVLAVNESASCLIINDDIAPTLTLVKSVTNDNGGAATADGFTLNLQGADGTHDTAVDYGNNAMPAVLANVVYTMDETLIDGYANEGVVCEDTGDGGGPVDHPVTLALGQNVTCTLTNNDIAPTLTMLKDVVNDDGGVAVEADFAMTLSGTDGTHDSGADYFSGEMPVIFAAVQYTITEDPVPAGYTMTGVVCTDTDTQAEIASPFTPLLDQNIECTVTNDDIPPTLTLVKTVIDDDGGSTPASSFPLKLTGADGTHDSGVNYVDGDMPVIQGTIAYTITEVPPQGYELIDVVCQDVTGADVGMPFTAISGDEITCTVTNDDVLGGGATFTVTKDFSDNNPMEIEVQLTCNAGLPLQQTFMISEATPVMFIIESYEPGSMDCWIEEISEGSTGYTTTYLAGAVDGDAFDIYEDDTACFYDAVVGGEFTCELTNALDPAVVIVNKEWFGDLEQIAATVEPVAEADYQCFDVLTAPDGIPVDVEGKLSFYGNSYDTIDGIYPYFDGSSYCVIEEVIVQNAVEGDDSDCANVPIMLGGEASCTIKNTVFFEGIPTLNQYGLMIMALLMLGIGAIGFRRFS